MIVKTNRQDKSGRDIYANALTGQEGLIDQIVVQPSQRRDKRNFQSIIQKVKTNRKATLGRNISYQDVNKKVGEIETVKIVIDKDTKQKQRVLVKKSIMIPIGKTIKHIQETPSAIERKTSMLNLLDRIEINKSKWHKANPEYQKKVS